MRLWHEYLIPYLDNKRILGQHRECCALRGKGWGKKHSVVNYIFEHNPVKLYLYHCKIMSEMAKRNYNVSDQWCLPTYRGIKCDKWSTDVFDYDQIVKTINKTTNCYSTIYLEHNNKYLRECLENLKSKNANLVNGKSIDELLLDLDLKGY